MPRAGQRVKALDFPDTMTDEDAGSFTFNDTAFGIDADTGSYADVGGSFTVGTSGKIEINWGANLDNNTAGAATNVSPVIRTGATVGAGATVLAASLARVVRNVGTDDSRQSASYTLTGLTPGDVLNCRVEHRVSGGIGTVHSRDVSVKSVP
jgi:hypothetical protein